MSKLGGSFCKVWGSMEDISINSRNEGEMPQKSSSCSKDSLCLEVRFGILKLDSKNEIRSLNTTGSRSRKGKSDFDWV